MDKIPRNTTSITVRCEIHGTNKRNSNPCAETSNAVMSFVQSVRISFAHIQWSADFRTSPIFSKPFFEFMNLNHLATNNDGIFYFFSSNNESLLRQIRYFSHLKFLYTLGWFNIDFFIMLLTDFHHFNVIAMSAATLGVKCQNRYHKHFSSDSFLCVDRCGIRTAISVFAAKR